MFTGLIEEIGTVVAARAAGGGREFEVAAPRVCAGLAAGDSVCVSGACQTVTAFDAGGFRFFAMGETLRASTLGRLKAGDRVNLERALTPASRMGGHLVTGHVDGVGRIAALHAEMNWLTLRLTMAPSLAELLVPKGSLAVDGVSLTVGPEVQSDGCELFLIPHTISATTLGTAKVGDAVNLEADLIGKYVLRYMQRGESRDGFLLGLLRQQGFIGSEEP